MRSLGATGSTERTSLRPLLEGARRHDPRPVTESGEGHLRGDGRQLGFDKMQRLWAHPHVCVPFGPGTPRLADISGRGVPTVCGLVQFEQ